MRIEILGITEDDKLRKATAKVLWEDSDRPSQELFFGVPKQFGEYLCSNSHAFLAASLLPAINARERRIAINQDVCPKLKQSLPNIASFFSQWYGRNLKMPNIETKGKSQWSPNAKSREAGSFLSGGIDSLALLRANRLRYPPKHKKLIKHCFLVYGFDMGAKPGHIEAFDRTVASLSDVAQDAGVKLVPVYTNIKTLNDDLRFWLEQFHGACLAAVGHAVAQKIDSISIAASDCFEDLHPWGSHPLIDHNYSSADLRVEHVGFRYTRIEKTQLIADWEAGLHNVRVCTQIDSALRRSAKVLNCGKCEKCIRTMTALLAIGALDRTQAFGHNNVSKEMLKIVPITKDFAWLHYRELIEPLKLKGRNDLARAIKRMLLLFRIREGARSLEHKLFKGRFSCMARRLLRKT